MNRPLRRLCAPVLVAAIAVAAPVAAQKSEAAPRSETYLCPNVLGGAVECFLDAVSHLYTMCRQVKSIEIIEFGYERSTEGTNGAKSEYCVDKHRLSMKRPYQSALREASASRTAVDGLRAMHDLWLIALAELKWRPGESDDEYKERVARPYPMFHERAGNVRAALPASKSKESTAVAAPLPLKSAN